MIPFRQWRIHPLAGKPSAGGWVATRWGVERKDNPMHPYDNENRSDWHEREALRDLRDNRWDEVYSRFLEPEPVKVDPPKPSTEEKPVRSDESSG